MAAEFFKKNSDRNSSLRLNIFFDRYKKNLRLETAIERVKEIGIPLVYANQIGGQDELVFDGSSFAINSDQSIVSQAPAWKESFLELDFHKDKG